MLVSLVPVSAPRSYNSINGVPTCASEGLLTEVLRGHLNFT